MASVTTVLLKDCTVSTIMQTTRPEQGFLQLMNITLVSVTIVLLRGFFVVYHTTGVEYCIYTDPKWKLYIVFKSIYFDDKLSFGVIFSVIEKKLDEHHKLHNFYE